MHFAVGGEFLPEAAWADFAIDHDRDFRTEIVIKTEPTGKTGKLGVQVGDGFANGLGVGLDAFAVVRQRAKHRWNENLGHGRTFDDASFLELSKVSRATSIRGRLGMGNRVRDQLGIGEH